MLEAIEQFAGISFTTLSDEEVKALLVAIPVFGWELQSRSCYAVDF